mgnify:CR=1 FL=1
MIMFLIRLWTDAFLLFAIVSLLVAEGLIANGLLEEIIDGVDTWLPAQCSAACESVSRRLTKIECLSK